MSETAVQAAVAYASDTPLHVTTLGLRAPAAGELLVKLVATSVCHTDIMTKREGLCAFPIVLGHEGVGVVAAVGSGGHDFSVGDHVILSYASCGSCASCAADLPSYCHQHGALNFAGVRPDGALTHRSEASAAADVYGSFFQQSSFATYALSDVRNTIKVDPALPLEKLAPLGCGVQTGAGTVLNTLKVTPGSSVAVFGCGCVGLSAILAARLAEARQVIAIDLNPRRLAAAAKFGAEHCIAPGDDETPADLVEYIRDLTSGGCQYAIDTTGVPAVLRQAFDSCAPRGVTAMIAPGVPGTEVCIEMLGLLPGKSLRGVVQGDSVSGRFIPQLIEYWQQGRFPYDAMISEYHGIESVETAMQDMQAGKVIKPVIILEDSA